MSTPHNPWEDVTKNSPSNKLLQCLVGASSELEETSAWLRSFADVRLSFL